MLYRLASPDCLEVSRCTKIVDKWRFTDLSSLHASSRALYKWSYQKIQIQHSFSGFSFDSVSRSELQTLFEGWHLPFGKAVSSRLSSPPRSMMWSMVEGLRKRSCKRCCRTLAWRGGGGEGGTGGTRSKHQNAGDGYWGRISHNKMARVQTINTNHRNFLKKGVFQS